MFFVKRTTEKEQKHMKQQPGAISINNSPPLLPSALHIPDFNSTVADNVYHDDSHISRAHSRLLPLSSLSKDVLTQLTAKIHSNGETRKIMREMIAVCHNSMDPEGLARILMEMSPEEVVLTAIKCKWGVDDCNYCPCPPHGCVPSVSI